MNELIHVAVATIVDSEKRVLLALRQAHQHQGDLWEFPGGKVEQNETVHQALNREIDEEVGLSIIKANPLIEVTHDYGDKVVLLDVWLVEHYEGVAQGREGQTVRWCPLAELVAEHFPAANLPIINALQLI